MGFQGRTGGYPLLRSALFIFIVMALPLMPKQLSQAQTAAKKAIADTSKVIVTDGYFKTPEKKSALFDSSGRQLNTQQMVDFIKSELRKLNEEINIIVKKAVPDSANTADTTNTAEANDVDVMRLFIIKGKLESMEKTLDEWTKLNESEINTHKEESIADSKKSIKKR